jgi:FMN phosphatase YigB (HAD superfamily)
MQYVPKPDQWVYEKALQMVGSPDPSEVIFFEDTLRNLKPAWELGIQTVWVDLGMEKPHFVGNVIPSLQALPQNMVEPKPAFPIAFTTAPAAAGD